MAERPKTKNWDSQKGCFTEQNEKDNDPGSRGQDRGQEQGQRRNGSSQDEGQQRRENRNQKNDRNQNRGSHNDGGQEQGYSENVNYSQRNQGNRGQYHGNQSNRGQSRGNQTGNQSNRGQSRGNGPNWGQNYRNQTNRGQNHGNETNRGPYEEHQVMRDHYHGAQDSMRQNPGCGCGPPSLFAYYPGSNLHGTGQGQNMIHPSQNYGLLPDPVRYGYNDPRNMQYPKNMRPPGPYPFEYRQPMYGPGQPVPLMDCQPNPSSQLFLNTRPEVLNKRENLNQERGKNPRNERGNWRGRGRGRGRRGNFIGNRKPINDRDSVPNYSEQRSMCTVSDESDASEDPGKQNNNAKRRGGSNGRGFVGRFRGYNRGGRNRVSSNLRGKGTAPKHMVSYDLGKDIAKLPVGESEGKLEMLKKFLDSNRGMSLSSVEGNVESDDQTSVISEVSTDSVSEAGKDGVKYEICLDNIYTVQLHTLRKRVMRYKRKLCDMRKNNEDKEEIKKYEEKLNEIKDVIQKRESLEKKAMERKRKVSSSSKEKDLKKTPETANLDVKMGSSDESNIEIKLKDVLIKVKKMHSFKTANTAKNIWEYGSVRDPVYGSYTGNIRSLSYTESF